MTHPYRHATLALGLAAAAGLVAANQAAIAPPGGEHVAVPIDVFPAAIGTVAPRVGVNEPTVVASGRHDDAQPAGRWHEGAPIPVQIAEIAGAKK